MYVCRDSLAQLVTQVVWGDLLLASFLYTGLWALLLLGYLLGQVLPECSLGTEHSDESIDPYEVYNADEVTFPHRHPEQGQREGRAGQGATCRGVSLTSQSL